MSRDAILGKIRGALGVDTEDPERGALVAKRLDSRERHLLPGRIKIGPAELTDLFTRYLEASLATVVEVPDTAAVPQAVADYLRQQNLPQRVRMGDDRVLAGLPWERVGGLETTQGPAVAEDTASLSLAVAGIAETGTLMLASGADNPVTLTFLPETHIVVVNEDDVVGPYEDGWERIRARFGAGKMPRTVNMVTGPSRTADIGGRLVIGAHGPRRLCVIVVRRAAG